MKLLLRLGNKQTKVVDHVTKAEEFADLRRVFSPSADEQAMECPNATIKPRYWLIHSEELKKPIRCVGFEVVQEENKTSVDRNGEI